MCCLRSLRQTSARHLEVWMLGAINVSVTEGCSRTLASLVWVISKYKLHINTKRVIQCQNRRKPPYESKQSTENTINLPKPQPLPGSEENVSFVIIGDEASPFKPYLSKAYPTRTTDDRTRIYNYRLSRGRRIVANAFGIPASGFGVLKSQLHWIPQKQSLLSWQFVPLHNCPRCKNSAIDIYAPPCTFDNEDTDALYVKAGEWKQEPQASLPCRLPRAKLVRESNCSHVNTDKKTKRQQSGM